MIEDGAAHAEPESLEEGRPEPGGAVVDGDVVLPLVGRLRPRLGIDGVRAPAKLKLALSPGVTSFEKS